MNMAATTWSWQEMDNYRSVKCYRPMLTTDMPRLFREDIENGLKEKYPGYSAAQFSVQVHMSAPLRGFRPLETDISETQGIHKGYRFKVPKELNEAGATI